MFFSTSLLCEIAPLTLRCDSHSLQLGLGTKINHVNIVLLINSSYQFKKSPCTTAVTLYSKVRKLPVLQECSWTGSGTSVALLSSGLSEHIPAPTLGSAEVGTGHEQDDTVDKD